MSRQQNNTLQSMCCYYLSKLRYMGKKHGIDVDAIIRANKRKNSEQHYHSVNLWGGQEKFEQQQERDFALRQYCKKNGIKLLEIPYNRFDDIELILGKKIKKK